MVNEPRRGGVASVPRAAYRGVDPPSLGRVIRAAGQVSVDVAVSARTRDGYLAGVDAARDARLIAAASLLAARREVRGLMRSARVWVSDLAIADGCAAMPDAVQEWREQNGFGDLEPYSEWPVDWATADDDVLAVRDAIEKILGRTYRVGPRVDTAGEDTQRYRPTGREVSPGDLGKLRHFRDIDERRGQTSLASAVVRERTNRHQDLLQKFVKLLRDDQVRYYEGLYDALVVPHQEHLPLLLLEVKTIGRADAALRVRDAIGQLLMYEALDVRPGWPARRVERVCVIEQPISLSLVDLLNGPEIRGFWLEGASFRPIDEASERVASLPIFTG